MKYVKKGHIGAISYFQRRFRHRKASGLSRGTIHGRAIKRYKTGAHYADMKQGYRRWQASVIRRPTPWSIRGKFPKGRYARYGR